MPALSTVPALRRDDLRTGDRVRIGDAVGVIVFDALGAPSFSSDLGVGEWHALTPAELQRAELWPPSVDKRARWHVDQLKPATTPTR